MFSLSTKRCWDTCYVIIHTNTNRYNNYKLPIQHFTHNNLSRELLRVFHKVHQIVQKYKKLKSMLPADAALTSPVWTTRCRGNGKQKSRQPHLRDPPRPTPGVVVLFLEKERRMMDDAYRDVRGKAAMQIHVRWSIHWRASIVWSDHSHLNFFIVTSIPNIFRMHDHL